MTSPGSAGRRPASLWVACAFVAACLLAVPLARAHPIHSALAEADYNAATKKLEVALRVFADDFEAALSARAKARISFEKTPRAELDALARAYVTERFTLRSPDGTPAALAWIGRDYKEAANECWLFFEFHLPAGLDDAQLHAAVLADRFPDQLNTVTLRDGPRRLTLVFLASHGPKRIRFRPD